MSLKDRLAVAPVKKSNMDVWFEALPPDEREAVMTAIRDHSWDHISLRDALADEGAPRIADTTFGRWRKRMGWTA